MPAHQPHRLSTFEGMTRQEFHQRCIPYFSADEIQAFWLWFQHLASSEQVEDCMQRLLAGEPIQYIFGTAPFHRYEYRVGPGCLIPRPETEELVEYILQHPQIQALQHWLDIGTGSGCIALTLVQERPWQLLAVDCSEAALTHARNNRARLNTEQQKRLELRCSDFLKWTEWPSGVQALVSNPPYISSDETLDSRVVDWEPSTALFAENDPLIFYKKMAQLCLNRPHELWLFLEINQQLPEATEAVFKTIGCSTKKIADLSGNLRFIEAYWPGFQQLIPLK